MTALVQSLVTRGRWATSITTRKWYCKRNASWREHDKWLFAIRNSGTIGHSTEFVHHQTFWTTNDFVVVNKYLDRSVGVASVLLISFYLTKYWRKFNNKFGYFLADDKTVRHTSRASLLHASALRDTSASQLEWISTTHALIAQPGAMFWVVCLSVSVCLSVCLLVCLFVNTITLSPFVITS